MKMVVSKPENTEGNTRIRAGVSDLALHTAPLQPTTWDTVPALRTLPAEESQTLAAVMTAICEDCSEGSLQYVLRSDTGHDGE